MEAAEAHLSLHISKCHIVENHMHWQICLITWVKVCRIIPEFRILRLKMLNMAGNNSFFDLFSAYLKTINHLNLKLFSFDGMYTASLKLRFFFRNFELLPI